MCSGSRPLAPTPLSPPQAPNSSDSIKATLTDYTSSFTAVLSEMPPESWQPDPAEVERRKDFRESHLIMSIDPKGCEDVDDALSIRKLKNGRIELGGDLKTFLHNGILCHQLSVVQ